MESPPHEAEHCIVGVEGGGGRDRKRHTERENAGCDFKKCQNMSNADTTQGFH